MSNVVFDFVSEYYGVIVIFFAVTAIYFGRKMIDRHFEKQRQKKSLGLEAEISAPSVLEDEAQTPPELLPAEDSAGFFGDSRNVLAELKQQKRQAEDSILKIKADGKRILVEETKLNREYGQKKAGFASQRQALHMRYNTWNNQLKLIDGMIQNQEQMEESVKQLKKINR